MLLRAQTCALCDVAAARDKLITNANVQVPGAVPAVDNATLGCVHRYAWDSVTGKLSTTFNAQAEKAVGLFSSRAANPVVQAASADSTEAVVWEVRSTRRLQRHMARPHVSARFKKLWGFEGSCSQQDWA